MSCAKCAGSSPLLYASTPVHCMKHRNSRDVMAPQPLTGKKILVTRAAHQAGKLSDALRESGAIPVEVPVLEIQPPKTWLDWKKQFASLIRTIG